jgi:S-DNA-T family DNA segregation ATPase FtsK/SpoIIIE
LNPLQGVKVSKILNLADDLALGMKAESVRIVGPIPGKGRIGIEIANRIREKVYLSEIISSEKFRRTDQKLPLALGKDIAGEPVIADLEPYAPSSYSRNYRLRERAYASIQLS